MTLLPTRRRLSLLHEFMKSAVLACTSTPGLVLIDEEDYSDDQAEYDYMKREAFPENWDIIVTKAESMGDKVREVWHMVESNSNWVNILNDDHVIKTRHWDQKLLPWLNGKNFVSCNDGSMEFCHMLPAGATIWSMPLLKAVGFPIFPNNLQHLFIDNVWKIIGENTGCWYKEMKVTIDHVHALKDKSKQDETFHMVYDDYFRGQKDPTQKCSDQLIFEAFMQNNLEQTVARIKKFQSSEDFEFVPTGMKKL